MVSSANVTTATAWPEYGALPIGISQRDKNVSAITPDHFSTAKRVVNGVVIPLLYIAIFIIGIIANSIVLYASSIFKRTTKGAIDIYVGNLAIADLSLIATLPVWIVMHIQQGVWKFGTAMCKIVSMLTHINMYSSVFLITAMAIDRHTVVVQGIRVRTKSLRSASKIWFKCGTIWCFSIILSIPSAVFRTERFWKNSTYCSWKYPTNQTKVWWAVHVVERNVIGFLIPLVIICRCYIFLISYIKSRGRDTTSPQCSEVRSNQVHRITKMVTTIILAFMICWLPNQTSNFMQSLIHYKVIPLPRNRTMVEVYYLLHIFFTSLSFCNSVINPIIYSTSPSHRSRVKELFARTPCCSTLCRLLFTTHKSLQPSNCENGSPKSFHRNRRTMVTRIGHNGPGSPHATLPTSDTSIHLGDDQTGGKQYPESCVGTVEFEGENLLRSPTNLDIPVTGDTRSTKTFHLGAFDCPNHHDFNESNL